MNILHTVMNVIQIKWRKLNAYNNLNENVRNWGLLKIFTSEEIRCSLQYLAAVSCSPYVPRLGGLKWGFSMGKPHCACVGAWLGAWVGK